MSAPVFNTGFKSVEEAAAKQKSKGGVFLRYITWDTNETKILRFLNDDSEIITATFYEFVQTNTGGMADFLIMPGMESVYESYVNWETGVGLTKGRAEDAGKMVMPEARTRTVAIAVLQAERDGQIVDLEREIDLGEKGKFLGYEFGVVKQSEKLFWSTMGMYNNRYKTICDRPYEIKKTGTQLTTDYGIIPAGDKEDGWVHDGSSLKALQARYHYGEELADKDDPNRFYWCPMTLVQWATERASKERMEQLLGGPYQPNARPAARTSAPSARTPSGMDEFHADTTHNPGDEAQAAGPGDAFPDLRERLNRHASKGATPS